MYSYILALYLLNYSIIKWIYALNSAILYLLQYQLLLKVHLTINAMLINDVYD